MGRQQLAKCGRVEGLPRLA